MVGALKRNATQHYKTSLGNKREYIIKERDNSLYEAVSLKVLLKTFWEISFSELFIFIFASISGVTF